MVSGFSTMQWAILGAAWLGFLLTILIGFFILGDKSR